VGNSRIKTGFGGISRMNGWVFRAARLCVAGLYLAGAVGAWAADDALVAMPPAPPDPASVHVPDLSFVPTPRDAGNYDEYFYFNKPGVSFTTAWNDLNECARYSVALRPMGKIIQFAPLGSGKDPENRFDAAQWESVNLEFGFFGSIIAGAVLGALADDNRRGNTRQCMGYKGYTRYGLTRALWHEVNKGKDADVQARLALIASGPAPAGEKLDP
jgi:hypothetical protein